MAGGPIRIAVLADAKDAVAGFKATGAAAERMAKQAEASSSRASKFGSTMKLAFAGIAGAVAASKVKDFLSDSIAEARESQKVGALTAQVIKSTGQAANISAAQVGNLATAISNKTGIDDEAIQSGENMLLTFTNVRNEVGKGNKVFNEATRLATDMAAALGGDAKSAAMQLGKALNDPAKGVSKLARSGVSFTEQQIKQIKAMQETGNVLGAQKIILGEVSKEFGGAAAASSTAGEKMATSFGNLKEQVGTALLPVLDKAESTLTTKVIPAVSNFIAQIQSGEGAGGRFASVVKTLGRNIGTIAPAIGVVVAGLAAYRAASAAAAIATKIQAAGTVEATGVQWSLNAALRANPIGLVITALTALGVGIVVAYKHSETFRNIVNGAFNGVKRAGEAMWKGLKAAFKFIVDAFLNLAGAIVNGAAKAFGWIPGIGGKLKGAAAAFNGFRDDVNASLDGIHKDVSVTVTATLRNTAFYQALTSKRSPKSSHAPMILAPRAATGAPLGGIMPRTAVGAAADAMTGLLPRAAANHKSDADAKAGALRQLSTIVKTLHAGTPKIREQMKAIAKVVSDGVGKKEVEKVKASFQRVTEAVKRQLDKTVEVAKTAVDKAQTVVDKAQDRVTGLTDKLSGLNDALAQMRSTVTGNWSATFDSQTDPSAAYQVDPTTGKYASSTGGAVSAFVKQLTGQKGLLDSVTTAYKKLIGEGLNGDWLQSLFASGNNSLILDLASSSKSDALGAQSMFQQVQAEADALGTAVANNTTTRQQVTTASGQLAVANKQLANSEAQLHQAQANEKQLAKLAAASEKQAAHLVALINRTKNVESLLSTVPQRAGKAFGQEINTAAKRSR